MKREKEEEEERCMDEEREREGYGWKETKRRILEGIKGWRQVYGERTEKR